MTLMERLNVARRLCPCGFEPVTYEGQIYCDSCLRRVNAAYRATPRVSPWVRRAADRELPAKVVAA
jgi:hypothetical protein